MDGNNFPMNKVQVSAFSVSLDGFGAGPRQDRENPLGVRGLELHEWFRHTTVFRKMQKLDGGSQGVDTILPPNLSKISERGF